MRLLNEYLDRYGRDALHCAVEEALKSQSPYPQAVLQILERTREENQKPPPIPIALPDKVKHVTVKAANVADYDQLYQSTSGQDHE